MNVEKNRPALRVFVRSILRRLRPKKRGKPAVDDINAVQAVYNDVFENVENYDTLDRSNEPKLKYVLRYAQGIDGQVLDAGCASC